MEGLTSSEAAARLRAQGPNATPDATAPVWRRALAKLWAPVPWMLEAAIVLQLVLGEFVEAAVIAGLVLFNAILSLVQEGRAQATLDALKARLALNASVRRDGAWKTVPAAEVVAGDVVKLSLGGVVAADVRILEGEVLIDQSMLTGESLPIEAGPGLSTYAGALIRRGEAVAEVTATGPRTRFGRTAELVRSAHAASAQEQAVLRVVRNLVIFNGVIVLVQAGYGARLGLPIAEFVSLVLTAVLAAIPVALPATFTLAAALGARALARNGVLPTRLAAVDEAATLDVLCADKTGTLTQNQLTVTKVVGAPGVETSQALALAALASSGAGGGDPVDAAIRTEAERTGAATDLALVKFTPFDPAAKTAEAVATDPAGRTQRIVKGAFQTVSKLAPPAPDLARSAEELQALGFRVLAVAAGPPDAMRLAGLVALSDPPRPDSAPLIQQLKDMGVRTVMVTGDSAATAAVAARAVGLDGAICPPGAPLDDVKPEDFAVFAGVFPEDKFHIVQAFQKHGHAVGMCGDGANDAPALRQAQTGIAVSTATDVAKSAAGIVLTEPGLAGIVASVREGRITFQRILTYTLRSLTRKIDQMLFLTVGLVMTGHPVLTPMLMVILMITGDFLAMSATTDNVQPSARPNAWRIGRLTAAGAVLGLTNLLFCSGLLAFGVYGLRLAPAPLQTYAAVILVFSGQAVFYAVRERRRMWSSRPSGWFVLSSVADVGIISVLAGAGVLMAPIPPEILLGVAALTAAFAFLLDAVKARAFVALDL
ncbi:MAG: HAD-IC family P-type ATPase [Alphaproteobacteria bacterium]|nr:HAD-IC family P-type ATPase [Alphaproteobacteria bacterium]